MHLTFSAPWQSYCTVQPHRYRTTETTPSRSAIIGMIMAAMGIPRGESMPELDQLTISVTPHQGTPQVETDFHTIRGCAQYDGGSDRAVITHREYLAGSQFDVELNGPDELLQKIRDAIQHPHWQLYLGRRACVPDRPMFVYGG